MKWMFLLLWCPLLSFGQYNGRQDDSLRKIADTMHFAEPFAFKFEGTSHLSKKKLYNRCYAWILSIKDSLPGIELMKDPSFRKLTTLHVPATANITCNMVIIVNNNHYTCTLQQYMFHGINGGILPVEKAGIQKDYRETVNIERVIISRNYPQIFNALKAYLAGSK